MVRPEYTTWQGIRQHSPFVPLSLVDMQGLIARADLPPRERLIYALLVIHADALGNVIASARDLTRLSGYANDQSTHVILRALVKRGMIAQKLRGAGRRPTCWHLTIVRDASAA